MSFGYVPSSSYASCKKSNKWYYFKMRTTTTEKKESSVLLNKHHSWHVNSYPMASIIFAVKYRSIIWEHKRLHAEVTQQIYVTRRAPWVAGGHTLFLPLHSCSLWIVLVNRGYLRWKSANCTIKQGILAQPPLQKVKILLRIAENNVYTRHSYPYSNPEPLLIPEAEDSAPVPAPTPGTVSSDPLALTNAHWLSLCLSPLPVPSKSTSCLTPPRPDPGWTPFGLA